VKFREGRPGTWGAFWVLLTYQENPKRIRSTGEETAKKQNPTRIAGGQRLKKDEKTNQDKRGFRKIKDEKMGWTEKKKQTDV